MKDFEKLGVFYMGREYDLAAKKELPKPVLYPSKDLVTHAVCVGMTGSGKTGLCLTLLEEAAIDGIPALVIDPKGDLSNLMLTFPDLKGEDFEPWVNTDDARKKGVSVKEYAKQQAETWKKGLHAWEQLEAENDEFGGNRLKRLKASADIAIYTPGSNAGIPVSILHSFDAPPEALRNDTELLRERVNTTATSLLALLDIDADPVQSKEHILISTVLSTAWKAGKDMDLATLIEQLQHPPVSRIGVLDLETFFPSNDRFNLAMLFNNLLASPSFEAWMEGVALDIQSLLYTKEGKPRIAIFSIAHLNDTERMFFVSLFYNQIIGWMRQQPGTTSLRAIVYMDEIFGYFPPVKNPPSKTPMLTLLKQARAFGIGMMLATQNPVDIDYKGLANCGTWFIGRLQTERDKLRLLDGLEGAACTTGSKFDRASMEQILAGLGSRVFLLHDVNFEQPIVFMTRWALCYLSGPLTRNQIKALMDPKRPELAAGAVKKEVKSAADDGEHTDSRAILPPDVPQFFVPLRSPKPGGAALVYKPQILGCAQIYYSDAKAGVDLTVDYSYLAEVTDEAVAVNWPDAEQEELADSDLEKEPAEETCLFGHLPRETAKPKAYDAWKKSYADFLYRNQKLSVFKCDDLEEISKPNESERDFRLRLAQAAREKRDQQAEQLRQRYGPKIAAIDEHIRKAIQVAEKKNQASITSKLMALLSFGTSILSAFLGRKAITATTVGKITTSANKAGKSIKDSKDASMAEENVEVLKTQKEAIEAQFKDEVAKLETTIDPQAAALDEVQIRPKKSNISVRVLALAWVPWWKTNGGQMTCAWK
jgi:hypothetical protein